MALVILLSATGCGGGGGGDTPQPNPPATNPIAITTDYSGQFVLVATGAGELLTFRIDRDTRNLTSVGTETGVGASPNQERS